MNSYELNRKWFDFAFDNVDKVKSQHTALYVFAVEHNNRLGWKENFQLPTTYAMECTGIGAYKTYTKTLRDLIDFEFIKLISKSKNQFTANIIKLVGINKTYNKEELSSLDKAIINTKLKNKDSASVHFTKADTKADTVAIPKPEFAWVLFTKALTEADTEASIEADTEALTIASSVKNNHIPITINHNQKGGEAFTKCKAFFLAKSKFYYWKDEDDWHLQEILKMLSFSIEQTNEQQADEERADETQTDKLPTVFESFQFFIENLPQYWLEKKFTILNLSRNYNEINNETKQKYVRKATQTEQAEKIGQHTTHNLIDFTENFGK